MAMEAYQRESFFSLVYLLQHLNSSYVFPQKDILKLMREHFELVMPLDPLDVFL